MRTRRPRRLVGLSLTILLVALGAAGPANAATLFGLTSSDQLVSFDSGSPGTTTSPVPVTGLQSGETLLAIDFRPANGQLYGLGSTGRLYQVNPASGAATQVGSPGMFVPTGTAFGVDFNPVPDRLRVVSDADQNLRINPDTGAATPDTTLAYAVGDPNQAQDPNVVGAAYTNNFPSATATTLFGIDSNLDVLVTQNPPNNGTLNTVGPLGTDLSGVGGFDIAGDGTGFAAFGGSLYQVNLTTGTVTTVGALSGGTVLKGLAEAPLAGPITGFVARSPAAANGLGVDLANFGRPVEYLRVELVPPYTATQAGITGGPQAPCSTIPAGFACGPFSPPGFWPGGGNRIVISIVTNEPYPDQAGVIVFACAHPCFGMDAGPFFAPGPVPLSPGGGSGTGPNVFSFGNTRWVDYTAGPGTVNSSIWASTSRAPLVPSGVNYANVHSLEFPGGEIRGKIRFSPGESRRFKRTLVARARTSVRSGQRKRFRARVTRKGRALIRLIRRARLRKVPATIKVRVRAQPPGQPAQTKTFTRRVKIRVR